MKDSNERMLKILQADPEKLEQIDRLLEGRTWENDEAPRGPLLLGMSAAAKLLGVSRATLWRMIQAGRIEKVEILTGSYRVRRADIMEIVNGAGQA